MSRIDVANGPMRQLCSLINEKGHLWLMKTFLSPQNDAVFKLLFAKTENSDLLIAFLTAVLVPPVPIQSVTVLNPEIPKDAAADKSIVLDVVAKLQNEQLIDIEMQVDNRAGFRSRVLFYLCRLHQSQLEHAESYIKIKPSVSISVLGYRETTEENFHSIYEMKERNTNQFFSQDLAIHLIELPKVPKFLTDHPQNKGEILVLWSRFFNAKTEKDLETLAMENPIFQKAEAALNIIMGDPQAQEMARMRDKGRMMYELDMHGRKEEGRQEGRLEGRQEGKAEGLVLSIVKMHSHRMPAAEIAKMLDLELSFVTKAILDSEKSQGQ
jgi:predicted transposase/invertase (TIGR01784 family)